MKNINFSYFIENIVNKNGKEKKNIFVSFDNEKLTTTWELSKASFRF